MTTPIKKLDKRDSPNSAGIIIDKVNELIEAFNFHYHESLDTHFNTTSPKYPVERHEEIESD